MAEPMVWMVPQVAALLGLVARLWSRAVLERRRLETVRDAVRGLAGDGGGEVEIDDVRKDGSRLWVRMVATGTTRRER